MKLPVTLLALGLVSFFPEIAQIVGDRLAFLVPVHQFLLPAASLLARDKWIGVACVAGAVSLAYIRLNQRHEKKRL